jgi:hypothetical protein
VKSTRVVTPFRTTTARVDAFGVEVEEREDDHDHHREGTGHIVSCGPGRFATTVGEVRGRACGAIGMPQRLGADLSRLPPGPRRNVVEEFPAVGGPQPAGARRDLANARLIQQFHGAADASEFLNDRLRPFGITLEELDRIAEANELDVLDDKGRLVAGAFEVLNEVLEITIDQLTKFDPTSLTEQRMLEEWRSQFAGIEQTPEEIFRQTVEALGNIPTTIDERFAGVDLGDEEAVRTVFQKLLDDFEAGRISAEELDQLSKEGLFELFRQGAAYLDSFNEGVRKATLEMSNVPAVSASRRWPSRRSTRPGSAEWRSRC